MTGEDNPAGERGIRWNGERKAAGLMDEHGPGRGFG